MRLGVVAIARPTFDVPFAEKKAEAAFQALRASSFDVVGSPGLAMDEKSVERTLESVLALDVDAIVVLQATFADSTLVVKATDHDKVSVLWAFPEIRTGGRLRLNSLCGINLAAFTLTNLRRDYRWLHADPADPTATDRLIATLESDLGRGIIGSPPSQDAFSAELLAEANGIKAMLAATTIGRVGDRPVGFEPCGYDAGTLRSSLGVNVEDVPLPMLFDRSAKATSEQVDAVRERAAAVLSGVDDVDQESLDQSLKLKVGLESMIEERKWAGVATRCWPETFTDFGAAACTPMSILTEDYTPGSCEADVYGNITGLVLSWLTDQPSFVADLVDLDAATATGVMWHCGLAPFSMADPEAQPVATIHSNRKKPLLNEFPLKPGKVTIARFSQSRGVHRLLIGGGEMLREPLAFSGTAGVLRFERSAREVLDIVMHEGLEHHYGIVYGDVRDRLRALASVLELPIVEI